MRAAFYYPWYPEQWAAGHRHTPLLGLYDSGRAEIMRAHIAQMQYARIDAAIYSWWGKGSLTDQRFGRWLDECAVRGMKTCIYYEADWNGKASEWFRVRPDLGHLRDRYFRHPAYLRINDRPVVFVYTPGGSCTSAAKWKRARRDFGLYVSMSDHPEWWTCMGSGNLRIDSYHPYAPAERGKAVQIDGHRFAVAVSAGFWAAWETEPRLSRDFAAWQYAVSLMANSGADWQLVYWNEHGEGTAIEPSDARCEAYLCADYLMTLRGDPDA